MIGWDRQQLARLTDDVDALSLEVGIPHTRAVIPLKRGTILGSQLELLILSKVLYMSRVKRREKFRDFEDPRQISCEEVKE